MSEEEKCEWCEYLRSLGATEGVHQGVAQRVRGRREVTEPSGAEVEAAARADRTLGQKLVSPNSFDGRGPVPDKVREASKRIARLRVKYVNQWNPATENPLTTREVQELFDAAAVHAEWIRELYEAVHEAEADPERAALLAIAEAAKTANERLTAAFTSDCGLPTRGELYEAVIAEVIDDLAAALAAWKELSNESKTE